MECSNFTVVIPDNEFKQAKLEILQERGLSLTHRQLLNSGGDCASIPNDLMNVARIAAFGADEMYFYDRDAALGYVSATNEAQALRLLWRQLQTCSHASSALELLLRRAVETQLAQVPAGPRGEPLKTCRMAEWLAAGGADALRGAFHVAVFSDTGRGLAASCPLAAGAVFRLPRRFIFSLHAALQSELGPLYARLMMQRSDTHSDAMELHEDGVLLLHLVHERHNPQSWFAPYLELLPAHVSNGAMLPAAALAELDGLPALQEVLEVRERLQQLHQTLFPRLAQRYPQHFPEHVFTLESFLWARAIFDSRAFQIQLDGRVHNCLLPFVDFMNTSARPHVDGRGRFNAHLDAYEFQLLRPAAPGSQVFLHYGAFGNREQLLQFGLFDAKSETEAVPLWVEACAAEADEQEQEPADWARAVGALTEARRLQQPLLLRRGPLGPRTLAVLRTALVRPTDVGGPAGLSAFDPFRPGPARLETAALHALRLALSALLDLVLEAHPHLQNEGADPEPAGSEQDDVEELAVRQVVAYRDAYVALLRVCLQQVQARINGGAS